MTPLTEEQLRAMEERAARATPGPWIADGDADSWSSDGGYAGTWVETESGRWTQPLPTTGSEMARQALDARLIAAARSDVPALVAEVRRLNERIDRLLVVVRVADPHLSPEDRRVVDGESQRRRDAFGDLRRRAENAEAEVRRLRAAVAPLLAVLDKMEPDAEGSFAAWGAFVDDEGKERLELTPLVETLLKLRAAFGGR